VALLVCVFLLPFPLIGQTFHLLALLCRGEPLRALDGFGSPHLLILLIPAHTGPELVAGDFSGLVDLLLYACHLNSLLRAKNVSTNLSTIRNINKIINKPKKRNVTI
jgi:hypothetical protein